MWAILESRVQVRVTLESGEANCAGREAHREVTRSYVQVKART